MSKNRSTILVYVIPAAISCIVFVVLLNPFHRAVPDSHPSVDVMSYYPNSDLMQTHYLEGFNHINKQRSVLWFGDFHFDDKDNFSYKMYNSDPADATYGTCNWDQFVWTSDKTRIGVGSLTYLGTYNECGRAQGTPVTDITYTKGIVFLPRSWDGDMDWKYSSSTPAVYKENGITLCEGTTDYTGEIIGYEKDSASKASVIHWKTTQTTTWTSGPGSSHTGCRPGEMTYWEENYYLGKSISTTGGKTAHGLVRTYGGNRDKPSSGWDVRMDHWKLLPH